MQVDLRLASSYLLACTSAPGSGGGGGGTAKYAPPGELYAHLALSKDVSEDTCSGRLILNNCTSIFISPAVERENEKVLLFAVKVFYLLNNFCFVQGFKKTRL